MSVIDVDSKIANKTNSVVPALDNKKQDKVCSATQEVGASAKTEAAASAETMAAIAQHPLAGLFGKYGGEVWEEIFAALEQDRFYRQNGQDAQEQDTVVAEK